MSKLKIKKARRDWIIIIILFAIGLFLVSILAWQIYLSDEIGGGYLSSDFVKTDISIKTIDKNKLFKKIEAMEIKEVNFENIKNIKPKIVDPAV